MSSEKFEYSYKQVEAQQEVEKNLQAPIIDIIRHGKTDYKELLDPNFKFEPDSPDFKLDAEHLDINEKGIEGIRETAAQLAGIIDKDKEALLLVTSPGYRAYSSLLIIEDYLKKQGITTLNPDDKIAIARNLDQVKLKEGVDTELWMAKNKEFRNEKPENLTKPADEAHAGAAQLMGKELSDIFVDDYDKIQRKFNSFLRHMTNIGRYLSDETKQAIADRRLRIICLTHEEKPAKFMKATLGTEENLKNGQILEIETSEFMEKDKPDIARVTLYEKGEGSEKGQVLLERTFATVDNKE